MSKNELIYDLDEDTYFKNERMSNSKLTPLERSGAHFLASLESNDEPTRAQVIGKLIHTMVLEPEMVEKRYVLAERKLNFRTKEDKELREKTIAEDKHLVGFDDVCLSRDMDEAINNHLGGSTLLKTTEGDSEVSAFWTDEETGIECKGRFDFLSKNGFIVDLKTTVDASYDEFQRSITKFKYYRQAAMYMDAYKAITGKKSLGFVIVAVEKTAPFGVACFEIDDKALEQGRREYKALLHKYKVFKDNNDFHGYSQIIQKVGISRWALDEDLRND